MLSSEQLDVLQDLIDDNAKRSQFENVAIANPREVAELIVRDWLPAVEAAVRADMQREVQTVEELDALPVGTVFMNVQRQSAAWEVVSEETDGTDIRYMSTGNVEFFQSKTLVNGGPFTILFTPSTPNQTGAEQ